jgi:metal-responsive CopG/Arc/MetJ family transcriptional regulator
MLDSVFWRGRRMMKSNFSVDLDPNTCKELAKLMGQFPKKSRNGVIRHIINTYGSDRADEQYRLEWMENQLRTISAELKELQQQRR